jgi:hypothetical protein
MGVGLATGFTGLFKELWKTANIALNIPMQHKHSQSDVDFTCRCSITVPNNGGASDMLTFLLVGYHVTPNLFG